MNRKGFTLIELLVVIAIIAILSAILFPVFSQVRERTRQAQCMTQMHDISAAFKLYKEDTNTYPAALYGFAEIYHTQQNQASFYQGSGKLQPISQLFYKPLYKKQKYMNDDTKFLCPDTKDKTAGSPPNGTPPPTTTAKYPASIPTASGTNSPLQGTNYLFNYVMWSSMGKYSPVYADKSPSGYFASYLNGKSPYFYKYDNYDVQPAPNANLDGPDPSGAYEVHYALDWTGAADPKADYAVNPNQLKYGSLCDESHTIVTWCSEHALVANSDKVLVLTLSGTTKAVDKKTFYNKGPLGILR